MSADGSILVPLKYDSVEILQGFYLVKNGSKYGTYSFDESEILAPQFDGIYSSQDNEGNATYQYYWTKKGENREKPMRISHKSRVSLSSVALLGTKGLAALNFLA